MLIDKDVCRIVHENLDLGASPWCTEWDWSAIHREVSYQVEASLTEDEWRETVALLTEVQYERVVDDHEDMAERLDDWSDDEKLAKRDALAWFKGAQGPLFRGPASAVAAE